MRIAANTKKTVSDLETGLTYTSDKVSSIEKEDLPQLRSLIDKKIEELEEKVTLSEIHDRKQNLLIYGVRQRNEKEDIYEVAQDVFVHFMGISREEAARIPLTNAHRLRPPTTRGAAGARPQPPIIIIRFVRMIDRDRLLYGFERRPRQPSTHPSTSAQPHIPPPESSPFSKVTIRTDLPPKMKRERGRLASVAYTLRKKDHLATRIKILGSKIILQTRKITRNGAAPENWSAWSEPGNGEE